MRDIQLQSGRAITETLSLGRLRERHLFCSSCANDVAKSLENLGAIKVDVFPIVLLCGAFHCEKCNLKTGLLYEVRAGQS